MKSITPRIKTVNNIDEALHIVNKQFHQSGIKCVAFLNAHACLLARKNKAFQDALENMDILFRDGIGVKLLLSSVNIPAGYNANGTDLIPHILKQHHAKRIQCIGSNEPYLSHAIKKMKKPL